MPEMPMPSRFRHPMNGKMLHWTLAIGACVAAAAIALVARSQTAPPAIPLINLSSEPLYARGNTQKPTLTLALSVEFPTVGAQYTPGGNTDNTYTTAQEYLGYFDPDSCYRYNNDSNEDLRRFDRSGPATNRGCGGTGFSGNFMNWATSSAIDVLRLGLTGGDRVVDTASLTVLQRAVLRRNSFWNDSNFPAKQLTAANAANAVPNALRGSYTGDIWIANCLNRTHFGTAREGSCDTPQNNSNLGVSSGPSRGNVIDDNLSSLVGTVKCADEGNQCSFSGVKRVYYGALGKWKSVPASGGISCGNAVFSDPIAGVVKSCYIKDDTTGWTPPNSFGSAALSSNNFFYTRVQVCESSGGALSDPRNQFCLRYPNGNFKPVGNLQRYSDRVRVAAFGYLMDDDRLRYGGVLRAAMKYVGPKSYDIDGVQLTTTNPLLEWNENTGIFADNPDSAPVGKSGVINYLNQFGRTGATTGTYKTNDPVSELYYESLRYIQGLTPTPQAVSNINSTMRDGFNLYETWTDPHAGGSRTRDYSCVRNNIVLIGDVNTHVDKSIPGYTGNSDDFARAANIANNEPNFVNWTRIVGEFEAGRSTSYVDGDGRTRNTSNPNGTSGDFMRRDFGNLADRRVSDNSSAFIAGMSYWANTHDIRGTDWTAEPNKQRPGMRARTYILDVNEYGAQNDLNTRRSNQFFLASKYGGFLDASDTGNPYLNSQGALDNTNWSKDGQPGEAKTYFLSSSARSVLQALDDIFASIASDGNSIAGGGSTSAQVTTAGSAVYVASFDAANWSGDVRRFNLSLDGAGNIATNAATTNGSAAQRLNARVPSTRNIVIGRSNRPAGTANASPFQWANLDSTTQAALNRANPSSADDGRGELRLDFLRGGRSNESAIFRARDGVLGDIINSAVSYVGAPTLRFSDSNYQTFYQANRTRPPTLYVGANDGMMHAFNADTLEETFAYIPSWLTPNLSRLTATTYNSGLHTSYVDSTPAVAEAELASGWKTVLVSGTGAGGQGVFALDVTQPGNFSAAGVLWEFTDRDDPDLGNVVGQPQILKFRTSAPTAAAVYKWFAVVPSGVNNYANDGAFSTTGRPALFLLDLSKPASEAWSLNQNYYKISLPVTSNATTGTNQLGTGVITFNATAGASREVSQVYMGDLHGNLWRLDFTLQGTTGWTLNALSPFRQGNQAVPLYIAKDAAGLVQPITMQPLLAYGPSYGSGNSTIVFFGTGKYLESADNIVNALTQTQSAYALFDTGRSELDSSQGSAAISGRGRLKAGAANSSTGTVSVPAFTWGRPASDAAPERAGWYFDYPQAGASGGERQISGASIFGNTVIFGSIIPPSAAVDSCGGGSGYQYVVNLATGAGTSVISTVGILGKPMVLQAGDSSYAAATDNLGMRDKTERARAIMQGSTGIAPINTPLVAVSPTGRISWRQINNYNQLRISTP